MRNLIRTILPAFILLVTLAGCNKGTKESVSTSLVVGHWYIHHVYLRSYHSNVLIRDSTLPNLPQSNYVNFNSNGTIEYRYNTASSETGTYFLKGADSIYATLGGTLYKWKIDLLISTNFNVQTTAFDYPLHSFDTETYQSFVK